MPILTHPLCELFGKSKQAYYKYDEQRALMRAASRSFAIEYAKGIRVDDPGMGITKIWDMYRKEFRFEEEILGRDAFEDLLVEAGMKVRLKMRKPRTTDSSHGLPTFPNIVKDFIPTAPTRGTMAHRTGWYQVVSPGELEDFLRPGHERNHYTFVSTFGNCDRIWASRVTNGMYKFLPTTEPFTGARCYVDAQVMHPIRAKMGKDYMKNSVVDTTAAKKIADEGKKKDKKKGSDIVKKGVKGLLDILK